MQENFLQNSTPIDRGMDKEDMVIYTMEYYSAIKRNEMGSFVETWMDLETVIQSEVSEREKQILYIGLPWWCSGWESACQCRGHGFKPWEDPVGLGRFHMPRSNWAHEPQLLSLHVWSLCSTTREAAIVRGPRTVMKSGPRLPQLEKALAQKRRPNTVKNKQINK